MTPGYLIPSLTSASDGLGEEMQPQLPTPTAREALHPFAVSPEEGLFAVPQEKVIAQLNKLLKLKYTAMLFYVNYGDRLRAHYRDSVAGHFEDHFNDERKEAYEIARKITALGGEPEPRVSTVNDTPSLHQMIVTALLHEQQLVKAARELAMMAGENIALKNFAENCAFTDNHHADDMRRLMACECG